MRIDAEITTIHIPLLCCCATSFYGICFSIIKYCGYWNSQTLDRITDHANKFCKEKLNGSMADYQQFPTGTSNI